MSQGSLTGQKIDEYLLDDVLGEGGMAAVYRGLDTRLNRYVAVKVIRTEFRSESDYTMRFEREAQAIAQLEHPNIITIYRFGEQDGLLYMAMQYIDGADLAAVIESFAKDGDYIEVAEVIRLTHEMGAALDYAHSKGVIHRDIKPHNVMIDQNNHVFITDFGLALMTEIGTHGMVFGSPHYIAPEQAISSAGVVPQSDLYAMAVIVYEMLTNTVPFDADAPLDIAMMHMTQDVPSPRAHRADLSEEVEQVMLKALAKEPEDRYSTGEDFATALEQALADKPKKPSKRSSFTIADKVSLERELNPLPPIPPPFQNASAPPSPVQDDVAASPTLDTPPPPPIESSETTLETSAPSGSVETVSTSVTPQPTVASSSNAAAQTPPSTSRMMIYGVVAVVLVVVLGLFIVLSGGSGSDNASDIPASVVDDNSTTVAQSAFSTDEVVDNSPVSATNTNMPATQTDVPPTHTPVPVTQTDVPLVPFTLNGGRGLTNGETMNDGEFQVEGYCTRLNSDYRVDRNNQNWYCVQGGQREVTLEQEDFDEICRLTYRNPDASALLQDGDEPRAFRWRCVILLEVGSDAN